MRGNLGGSRKVNLFASSFQRERKYLDYSSRWYLIIR